MFGFSLIRYFFPFVPQPVASFIETFLLAFIILEITSLFPFFKPNIKFKLLFSFTLAASNAVWAIIMMFLTPLFIEWFFYIPYIELITTIVFIILGILFMFYCAVKITL